MPTKKKTDSPIPNLRDFTVVPCPECGAEKGDVCRSKGGKQISPAHVARVELTWYVFSDHKPTGAALGFDSVACAVCGAPEGSACVSSAGKAVVGSHVQRRYDSWNAINGTALEVPKTRNRKGGRKSGLTERFDADQLEAWKAQALDNA